MNVRTVFMSTMIATLAAGSVAAQQPPGSECVSGYNPNALVNVCTVPGDDRDVTAPGVGQVGTSSQPVCLVGDLCPTLPVPTYTPGSSQTYTVPGVPEETYVEIQGDGWYAWSPQELGWCAQQIRAGDQCELDFPLLQQGDPEG